MFGRKDESSIEWDGGLAPYEPITVVTYQGMSYTSRTYVPTGIDIHNTDYWACTGNYDAQVEQYRQEVLTFNGRITSIEGALPIEDFDSTNTVKSAISSADSKITALEDALPITNFDSTNTVKASITSLDEALPITDFDSTNTVKAAITAETTARSEGDSDIQAQIGSGFSVSNTIASATSNNKNLAIRGRFRGKKAIWVLDSWGSEGVYGVTNAYWRLVSTALGLIPIDLHMGSTGFVHGDSNNYIGRITNWKNTHTAQEISEISYVIVCGSINDLTHPANTIRSAVVSFLEYVNANFPNAEAIVIPCIGTENHTQYNSVLDPTSINNGTQTGSPWAYVHNTVFSATNLNKQFNAGSYAIDGLFYSLAGIANSMNTDLVHPTQVGHDIIAAKVTAALCGNYFNTGVVIDSSSIYYNSTRQFEGATALSSGIVTVHSGDATIDASSIHDNVLDLNMDVVINTTNLAADARWISIPIKGVMPITRYTPSYSNWVSIIGMADSSIAGFVMDFGWTNSSTQYTGINSYIQLGSGTPFKSVGTSITIPVHRSIPIGY